MKQTNRFSDKVTKSLFVEQNPFVLRKLREIGKNPSKQVRSLMEQKWKNGSIKCWKGSDDKHDYENCSIRQGEGNKETSTSEQTLEHLSMNNRR